MAPTAAATAAQQVQMHSSACLYSATQLRRSGVAMRARSTTAAQQRTASSRSARVVVRASPQRQLEQQQQQQQQLESAKGAPATNNAASSSTTTTTSGGACALRRAAAAVLLAAAVSVGSSTLAPGPAVAVLNSPNARIARTVDAALRRSIPAFNPDVKEVQTKLENTAFKLRIPQRKPWAAMQGDLEAALALAQDRQKMLYGVPAESLAEGEAHLADVVTGLQRSLVAVAAKDPDATSVRLARTLDAVGKLELLQAPGLPFSIPAPYRDLPRLVGRATVELQVERSDGSAAFFDPVAGGPVKTGKVMIVVDGYSAPISAGNFVANVADGLYNGRRLATGESLVLLSGSSGDKQQQQKLVPLEILPLEEFDPVYRSGLSVQEGELPVLPLSIYGAISHARAPDGAPQGFLSGTDVFVYKFDRQQSGLAGLSFDEGTFGVFGYVTEGAELLPRLSREDSVVKATVVAGLDKLVRP